MIKTFEVEFGVYVDPEGNLCLITREGFNIPTFDRLLTFKELEMKPGAFIKITQGFTECEYLGPL